PIRSTRAVGYESVTSPPVPKGTHCVCRTVRPSGSVTIVGAGGGGTVVVVVLVVVVLVVVVVVSCTPTRAPSVPPERQPPSATSATSAPVATPRSGRIPMHVGYHVEQTVIRAARRHPPRLDQRH